MTNMERRENRINHAVLCWNYSIGINWTDGWMDEWMGRYVYGHVHVNIFIYIYIHIYRCVCS